MLLPENSVSTGALDTRAHRRADVIVRAGTSGHTRSYRADVAIDGVFVHGTKVTERRGGFGEFWFVPATDRAWNEREVQEIRWLDGGVPS